MSTPVLTVVAPSCADAAEALTEAWLSAFNVHDPVTGKVLASLASATREDAIATLDAADAVQASLARTVPRERAEILRRALTWSPNGPRTLPC